MLVLSRKKNEGLVLYNLKTKEQIKLMVTDVRGDRCQLGLDASQDWKILRLPDHLDDFNELTSTPLEEEKE